MRTSAERIGRLTSDGVRPSQAEGGVVELRRKGLAESTIRSACTILLAVSDTADRDGALGLRMQDQQPTARGTRPTSSSDTGQRFSRPTARLAHRTTPRCPALTGRPTTGGFALIGESYVDQPWRRAARACGLPAEQVENPGFQTLDGLGEHTAEAHRLFADEPGLFSDPELAAHRMRLFLAACGRA